MAGTAVASRYPRRFDKPLLSTLIADFTDGSHTLSGLTGSGAGGDVQSDAGFPNAGTRAYTLDSRGIGISFQTGTTSQYAAARYIPDGKNAGQTIDLSGSNYIAVECEFPEGGGQVYDAIELWIATETGNIFTHYLSKTVASGADKQPKRCIFVTLFSEMTPTGGGLTSYSTVGKIDVRFSVHASAQNIPAQVFIRKIWKGCNSPIVCIGFDDAYLSQYNTVEPMLTAAGLQATLFPDVNSVGASGRMTLNQLTTLYNKGWDICGHQISHQTDIPVNKAGSLTASGTTATWVNVSNIPHRLVSGQSVTVSGSLNPEYNGTFPITVTNPYTFTYTMTGTPALTTAVGWITCDRWPTTDKAIAPFLQARAWLDSNGFTRARQALAFTNGVYSGAINDLLIAQGFLIGRTTNVGASPMARCMDPRLTSAKSWMQMPAAAMDQQLSSTVMGWVNNDFIPRRAVGFIYGHDTQNGVGTGTALTMDTAELQKTVTAIAALVQKGQLTSMTLSQLAQYLNIS